MLSLNNPIPLMSCSLDELKRVVRAVPQWTEVKARLLDQVIRSRVVDAIASSMDSEELFELQRSVVTLVPTSAQPFLRALDRDWIARWAAWADLLDVRAGALVALQVRRTERRSRRITRTKQGSTTWEP